MRTIKIEKRKISGEEYQKLRNSTNWDQLPDDMVIQALQHDLFSVCAVYDNETIGIGRIVGDGAIYFYVQDVIVLPEFQGQGVGRMIMEQISEYLQENTSKGSFIGLMAAEGSVTFYEKFGFVPRPSGRPGMYKVVK